MLPLALKIKVFCITLADLTTQQSERSAGITSLQFTVVVATTPVRCDRCH
jgi:hypothetical protein